MTYAQIHQMLMQARSRDQAAAIRAHELLMALTK
jgi:hypothetical protein